MNLQVKKLNDLELETISAGEHKHIQVYSSEEVKQYGGLHLNSNQTCYTDNCGNFCVVTTYTDEKWAAIKAKQAKFAKTALCIAGGAGIVSALVIGGIILYKKFS